MHNWLTDIGDAAGTVQFHAPRLTIDGNDSPGGGSATLDAERDVEDQRQEQDIADDDLLLDQEDIDSQPRGRRTDKQAKAYDELKSERDRLKAERQQKDRELSDLRERVATIEQTHETRRDVNDRTNANLERAKQRAREVVAKVKTLDQKDPQYTEKVYETFFESLYTDLPKAAEEISRETSQQVYRETRTREQLQADAESEAIDALEEAGLSKDHLKLVKFMAREKMETEGEAWFRTTPKDEQVPKLVEEVATMLRGTKRNSQDFKDEKRRHREAMDGTIESGSGRTRTGSRREEDDREAEGPGSILADLARLRKTQARNTSVMLRQAER